MLEDYILLHTCIWLYILQYMKKNIHSAAFSLKTSENNAESFKFFLELLKKE